MRTVLFISRYFPPMFDVGGKRAYRFARYLPSHGWRPIVWTGPVPTEKAIDPTPIDLPNEVMVLRHYYPSFAKEATGRMSDGTVASPVKRAASPSPALELWRQLKSPVDSELWLAPRAARALSKVIEENNVDAIYATSSPYSALVYGAAARAMSGLPLCLDLRDPWTLNFLHARRPGWVRPIDAWIEEALFRYAQRVVFTAESASEAYRAHLPDLPPGHIRTITNSFDPVQRPSAASPSGPITLTHFGNCYGPRSLATLIRALRRLLDTRALDPASIRILNLGRLADDDLALAASLGVGDLLQSRPFVPYEEGLELLAGSDLQILLAYGDETLFIPAKFFDYLLTGAPILGLARPSELTDYIDQTGSGLWVEPDDVEGCAAIIGASIDARLGETSVASRVAHEVDRFSSPRTAESLARLLDELVEA